jgi:predicted esterase
VDWARWLTLPGIHMSALLSEGWDAYSGASQWHEVPRVEPSLGIALGAMLDRSFTAITNIVTGVPSPDRVRRFNSDATSMRDFLDERGWLEDPAAYHSEPPRVQEWTCEDGHTWLGASRRGYQHLTWTSGYEPYPDEPGREHWLSREENRMMHAYVLEHEGEPRPWLVCVHGFGMGSPLITLNGFAAKHLHEELGLNLIFPVLPLHGPRGGGRMSGAELLEPDYLNLMHTFSQAVWDMRRTIDWVQARQARGVGIYGISLGGYVCALTASLVSQLACVIATIPMTDLSSAARDNEPWIFRRYEQEFELDWEATRAVTHVVSPLSIPPQVPRERLFICAGTADRVVRPNHARALWRHWGRPEIHWFPSSHVLGMIHPSVPVFVESCVRSAGLA